MCMTCVAQSTPMITIGLAVMRRRAFKAWVLSSLGRFRSELAAHQPSGSSGAN